MLFAIVTHSFCYLQVVKEDGEISNCLKSAVIIEHSMKEAINDSVSNVCNC